jgi:DNA-binding protein HU-beta
MCIIWTVRKNIYKSRKAGEHIHMQNVTKDQLVDAIASKTDLSKKDTAAVLEAFVDEVTSQIRSGKKVTMTGFVTMQVKERAARTGINPQTKEKIQIPAMRVPKFTAGKALKDAVK